MVIIYYFNKKATDYTIIFNFIGPDATIIGIYGQYIIIPACQNQHIVMVSYNVRDNASYLNNGVYP